MKFREVGLRDGTPQEIAFIGGTLEEDEETNVYVPVKVTDGALTAEAAQERRKQYEFFVSQLIGRALKLPGGAALNYGDLDPETGKTLRDPEVLGYWDEHTGDLIVIEERDLTKEAYQKLKEMEKQDPIMKFYLREQPSDTEKEYPTSGGTESIK